MENDEKNAKWVITILREDAMMGIDWLLQGYEGEDFPFVAKLATRLAEEMTRDDKDGFEWVIAKVAYPQEYLDSLKNTDGWVRQVKLESDLTYTD